jgi:hypothetical protein
LKPLPNTNRNHNIYPSSTSLFLQWSIKDVTYINRQNWKSDLPNASAQQFMILSHSLQSGLRRIERYGRIRNSASRYNRPLFSSKIFTKIWQLTLEEADSATQEKIVSFVAATTRVQDEPQLSIPTGLVVAGPSIASHGPFFARLGQRIKSETNSTYAVLTSGESPNLKTLLKNLIKKITLRVEDDDDDDGSRPTTSSRKGPKLLDFDLGHVQEWRKKNRVQSIVVAIQDSEAFDTALLIELVELF